MDFIKRNMPVVVIGGITLLVFLGIIIASEKKNTQGPELQYVGEDELIASYSPITGNENAATVLVEFSDFQCPACADAHPVLKNLLNESGDNLKFVYRHYPLPQHKNAKNAAIAAQAAEAQDAFWEYHDLLFSNQNALEEADLLNYAELLGLDLEKFKKDIKSSQIKAEVESDIEAATKLGVNSTPTFFLNGRKITITSIESLYALVNAEVESVKKQEKPPVTELQTDNGALEGATISLTPLTEANVETGFIEITYTENGFSPAEVILKKGEIVKWTNLTPNIIHIKQNGLIYDELKGGFELAPNKSFQFTVYKDDLLSYEETGTKAFGQIFVRTRE